MLPTAAARPTTFTPAQFSECLLDAVAADRRRDARDRAQHTLLLRPYVGSNVDADTFEAEMAEQSARNAELAEAARDILALWRVCTDRRGPISASRPRMRELVHSAA
jgi:hypothetical protein